MNFEVINDSGATVMHCDDPSCIPDVDELSEMSKSGYKFKIDSKTLSVKKIKETLEAEEQCQKKSRKKVINC